VSKVEEKCQKDQKTPKNTKKHPKSWQNGQMAQKGIQRLNYPKMGLSLDNFYAQNRVHK